MRVGADIFRREVQGVWADVAPFVDARVRDGAGAAGFTSTPSAIAALVDGPDLPRLMAALVRVALASKSTRKSSGGAERSR